MMLRQFPVDHKAEFEKYVFFLKLNMFLFKQYILAGELTKWLKNVLTRLCYICAGIILSNSHYSFVSEWKQ